MIYCVEDDDNIRELVIYTLETTGLKARGFADGSAFMEALAFDTPELILLDIMLPGDDGLELLKKLKSSSKTKNIPVIMVTAKGSEYDKVVGLDSGADDYVTKPFYMGELLARIRAALRKRENRPADQDLRFTDGDLLVDYERRRVEVDGHEVHLTPIEYKILLLLIANRGKVLTHHYILKEVWGYAEGVEAGTLRVFMATLRRKIEKNPSRPQHIITEVGVGYRFK